MMQTLFATILLMLFFFKHKPVGHLIARQQFHDIGKLIFAFTAFYSYLTYAHVLTYWYTNIPEETSYLLTRLQRPWLYFIIAAPFASFLVPFIIMVPKAAKWTSFFAIPMATLILLAQLTNMMLVVIPELVEPKISNPFWNKIYMQIHTLLNESTWSALQNHIRKDIRDLITDLHRFPNGRTGWWNYTSEYFKTYKKDVRYQLSYEEKIFEKRFKGREFESRFFRHQMLRRILKISADSELKIIENILIDFWKFALLTSPGYLGDSTNKILKILEENGITEEQATEILSKLNFPSSEDL